MQACKACKACKAYKTCTVVPYMDIVEKFVIDVLDVKPSDEFLQNYIASDGMLQVTKLMSSPLLLTGCVFRNLWSQMLGAYPPRPTTARFLAMHDTVNAVVFMDFLKQELPMFEYIKVALEPLEAACKTASSNLKLVGYMKEHLTNKFRLRYGLESAHVKDVDSKPLFSIWKHCVTHNVSLERIAEINDVLAGVQEKPVADLVPSVGKSVMDYFAQHSKIIEHYELYEFNPLNGSRNTVDTDLMLTAVHYCSVFDAIAHTLLRDSSFIRVMLSSYCIYWQGGDALSHERLSILMTAANNRDTKPIALMCHPKHANDIVLPFYYFKFSIPHHCIIQSIPKVCTAFVLVSDANSPPCGTLASKNELSIYFNIGDGKKDDGCKDFDDHFNRQLATTSNIASLLSAKMPPKYYTIADGGGGGGGSTGSGDGTLNNEFCEYQWVAHLTMPCPFVAKKTSYDPKFNVLLYDQFVLRYYLENKKRIDAAKIAKSAPNAVVLVDNRPNILSVMSIKITLSNLRAKQWCVVVVCNEENVEFYKKYLGANVKYLTKFNLLQKKFSLDVYNNTLKSEAFWVEFKQYKRVLLVQDDCMIVKEGVEDGFLKYSYVGAPWRRDASHVNPNKFIKEHINSEMVGNGGLSLRCPNQMLTSVRKYKHLCKQLHYDRMQQQPEDVFFSYCCKKDGASMPTYEEAAHFSTEQVCQKGSCGFHKMWVYHDLPVVLDYFNNYLQTPLFN